MRQNNQRKQFSSLFELVEQKEKVVWRGNNKKTSGLINCTVNDQSLAGNVGYIGFYALQHCK